MVQHNRENNPRTADIPLTADEIALKMKWVSPTGKPAQSRVSRRMQELFKTKDAMNAYRGAIVNGEIRRGFKKLLEDRSFDIDAIVAQEKDVDDGDDLD